MKRILISVSIVLIITSIVVIFVSCGRSNNNKQEPGTTETDPKVTKVDFTPAPSACGGCACTENHPTDEAKIKNALTFINAYVENCNDSKREDIVKWTQSNELTTNRFKTELKNIIDEAYKQDPEMGLDADPILDAQDYPDEGFEFDSFNKENNRLILKGKNLENFKVTIIMVNENGKWLVDGCGMVNIPKI